MNERAIRCANRFGDARERREQREIVMKITMKTCISKYNEGADLSVSLHSYCCFLSVPYMVCGRIAEP